MKKDARTAGAVQHERKEKQSDNNRETTRNKGVGTAAGRETLLLFADRC
jgi:hypothetical protein